MEPEKWYPAKRSEGDSGDYEVMVGGEKHRFPSLLVKERAVPDDTWDVRGGTLQRIEPGQKVPMLDKELECPEGHTVWLSASSPELRQQILNCVVCEKSYRLPTEDET